MPTTQTDTPAIRARRTYNQNWAADTAKWDAALTKVTGSKPGSHERLIALAALVQMAAPEMERISRAHLRNLHAKRRTT